MLDASLVVRSAQEADNSEIRHIVLASLGAFGIEVEFDGLDAAIASAGLPGTKNAIELVAELHGHICGCIALERMHDQQGKVFGFHVDHHYRGKGIGRSLLIALMADARQLGFKTLHLDTWDSMQSAISLYKALGWIAGPDPAPESGANRSYFFEIT
ncbi:GNAT family N-acetyltransferase [Undibacterium sp. Di27W]|uniref:GNAT family N-acetyltransferase n=1 Tax=Undibacterium sp. Di27W TaxID=3413036 RepID=UPI003BF438F6